MSSLEDKFLDEFKSIDLSLLSVTNGFSNLVSFYIFLLISTGTLLGLTMEALRLSIGFSSEAILIIFLLSLLLARVVPYSF